MTCCGECADNYLIDSARDGCNLTDPDNPVPIELVEVRATEVIYAGDGTTVLYNVGQIIPAGATDVQLQLPDGTPVVGPDGSTFIRSYYRDPNTGLVVDPATVIWSGDCSTPAQPDTEIVEFIDPLNPGAGVTRVWAINEVADDGTLTTTYVLADGSGTVYDPVAAGTVLVSESDFERAERCFWDAATQTKTTYLRIWNDEFSAYYLPSDTTTVVVPVGVPVACAGEEERVPGCITVEVLPGPVEVQVQGYEWMTRVDGILDVSTVRYTDSAYATATTATDGVTAVDLAVDTVTGFDPNGKCCPPNPAVVAV